MFCYSPIRIPWLRRSTLPFAFMVALSTCIPGRAQDAPAPKPAANPDPDVLVLSNGDTLHGKFVSEIAGKVTFHCDPLGDVSLGWDKIKELRTSQKFAVLDDKVKLRGKKQALQIPAGTLEVANQTLTVHPENAEAQPPIPVKDAQFIMDSAALDCRHSRAWRAICPLCSRPRSGTSEPLSDVLVLP